MSDCRRKGEPEAVKESLKKKDKQERESTREIKKEETELKKYKPRKC